MEYFVTFDKLGYLIHELLTCEVWKGKVFPLVKPQLAKISSIRSYIALYHEPTICNLLEILLYHKTACENSQDYLIELIDYCYRKFIFLTNWAEKNENKS
mmetsp:Transcript_17047/g.16268  ORF Transcript_17047/g.16268 Transcript_17047/m.16268 type:complete len:100 (+) Transcript_17047:202-501(+)